jgi:hypothetical protein
MPVIGGRNINSNDFGVMVGGAIVLVFSFFNWFSYPLGYFDRNGWNSGLFSFLAVVLGIGAAVLVALRVFANIQLPRLQWGWNFIVFAAAGVAAVLILLKLLIGYHSWDRSLGLYLSFVGALVETAFAYFAFKVSGETLPGGRRI